MNHRELGDSGVDVSEVGFGAWVVGTDWWGERRNEDAIELIQCALEEGITYFDTGDVYGHGDSETLLGEALAEHREEVTLATKIGYDFYTNPQAGHGELPKELDREYLETALEKSLERLGTDHVDQLQIHNANVEEIDAELLDFFDDVKANGTVDAIGWALGPSIGWIAEGNAAVEYDFDSVQLVYNCLEPDIGDEVRDTIQNSGHETSIIPRVPHSSGLLNEQVTPETELEEGDHRAYRPDAWYDTGWEKVEELRFLERDGERTMGQAAIQWLLSHDEVATVTPTFRTREDVVEWAGASDTPPLSADERRRVAELQASNFGIERDDGMDSYRSSVEGRDIDEAGLDAASAGD